MLENVKRNPQRKAEITDLYAWMDGGTVTVQLAVVKGNPIEIEFVQKVSWEVSEYNPNPGRLLLNKQVVDIRSGLEEEIITTLKQADFAENSNGAKDFEECLKEAIRFVESDDYIRLGNQNTVE